MKNFQILVSRSALYVIKDLKLNGFITWFEKKPEPVGEVRGVLMFTTGELCEEYIHKVMPARVEFVSVCRVGRTVMEDFVKEMLKGGVDYALVDVPPIATDQLSEGVDMAERELVREYSIVDLKVVASRFM